MIAGDFHCFENRECRKGIQIVDDGFPIAGAFPKECIVRIGEPQLHSFTVKIDFRRSVHLTGDLFGFHIGGETIVWIE